MLKIKEKLNKAEIKVYCAYKNTVANMKGEGGGYKFAIIIAGVVLVSALLIILVGKNGDGAAGTVFGYIKDKIVTLMDKFAGKVQ